MKGVFEKRCQVENEKKTQQRRVLKHLKSTIARDFAFKWCCEQSPNLPDASAGEWKYSLFGTDK